MAVPKNNERAHSLISRVLLAASLAILAGFTACTSPLGQNQSESTVALPATPSRGAAVLSQPFHPVSGGIPRVADNARGKQEIIVGAASGYQVTLHMMPPAQICDRAAFADGVRSGYVSTWNGLVVAFDAANAGAQAVHRPVFDAAAADFPDDARYRLRWGKGAEPVNACAAYGYQIGKIMGARQAYVDARGGV